MEDVERTPPRHCVWSSIDAVRSTPLLHQLSIRSFASTYTSIAALLSIDDSALQTACPVWNYNLYAIGYSYRLAMSINDVV